MARRQVIVDPEFASALRELRTRRGKALRDFEAISSSYIHDLEVGRKRPTPEIAAALDRQLDGSGRLADMVRVADQPARRPIEPVADESEALELLRRVTASDVGDDTLAILEATVDDLASAYASTPPAILLERTRTYLIYAAELLSGTKRITLDHHRRLIEVGGWLSLIAATAHIDLGDQSSALVRLRVAESLAQHAEHAELQAWTYETRAWAALIECRYADALEHAAVAQQIAPAGSSARIQATAQEGRAWARLGRRPETYDVLDRVGGLVAGLPRPDRPEHHFRYDPDKANSYVATTLTWIADPAAEVYARDVITHVDASRPRRVLAARLDLALALIAADKLEEAAAEIAAALSSDRLVPSHLWRAGEVIDAIEVRGLPEAVQLREAVNAIRHRRELPST